MEESNGREKTMIQEAIPTQALQPFAVGNKDAGDARWWFGGLAVIKATAADTGGQMSIIEITEPPGAEAPLHVHHREDEGFLAPRGECDLRSWRRDNRSQSRRLPPSVRATSRTAIRLAPPAAGCCSS